MRRRVAVAVCLIGALGLAACGGSGSASSRSGAGSGEASKPPNQILADAAAALRGAHGYVMRGQMTQNGQPLGLRLVATGPSSVELSVSAGPQTAELLALPNGAFIRANTAFWATHMGSRGALLANRWVQVPPTAAQGFSGQLGRFAPATLSRCLTEDHGKLSVTGKTTVDGHAAVVIKDAGNVPGDAPGTLAVATSGPPYPLQVRTLGPSRPGGRIDVCNDGKGGGGRGTLTLSQFNSVTPLKPPANPVRLGQSAAT